jgi:hypothetical protein
MRSTALLVWLGLASCLSCRPVPASLGETPEAARQHVNELATAVARRFGPATQDPALAALRPKLERAVLVPSRVFDDASAWTSHEGERRAVAFEGGTETGRYRLAVSRGLRELTHPGDYRGRLELERLSDGEYTWRLLEELDAGTVSGAALARAAHALLESVAGGPHDARALVRDALPRASAALGRLVSLDQLEFGPPAAGVVRVRLLASLHPGWLARGRFARYAAFLEKHALPVVFSLAIEGEGGARFWELDWRDGVLRLDLAVRDGFLVPLTGPLGRIPDRLHARVELTTKAGLFRSGFRDLVADVRLERDLARPGFAARFPREPDWQLPFLIEPLLRASLRRPFESEGARLAYALEARPGGRVRLARHAALSVRESWILRWFGSIVGGAASDYRRTAEAEAELFSYELLEALREDLGALLEADPR